MSTIIFKIFKANNDVPPCEQYATIEHCVFMCHCEVTCYFFPRYRHTVTSPVSWLCFIGYSINLSYFSQNFTFSRGSNSGLHPVGHGPRIRPAD